MTTRHFTDHEQVARGIPKTAANLGALGIKLDDLQPHLSAKVYDSASRLMLEYLVNFPEESTDHVDAMSTREQEHSQSTSEPLEKPLLDRNERMYKEGMTTVAATSEQIAKTINEEFEACGVQLDDCPEFDTAREELETEISVTYSQLEEKRDRYELLFRLFTNRPDIATLELREKMSEALVAASEMILDSPIMPEEPKNWRPGAKNKKVEYAHWLRSKERLLGKIVLPSPTEIMEDYYKSADAAYRRAIFGSRELILNLGQDSDKIDEIDEFQKRHYEVLGNQYLIALTPSEWATEHLESWVSHILYSDESKISQFLDKKATESHRDFGRRRRKDPQGNNYYQPYNFDQDWASARDRKSTRDYTSDQRRGSRYHYFNVEDFSAGQTSNRGARNRTSNVEDPATKNELSKVQTAAYRSIELMIDSVNLERDARLRKTIPVRLKEIGLKIIKSMDDRELQVENLDYSTLRIRIAKEMVVQLHPDRKDGGDKELCRYATDTYKQLLSQKQS